jgi:hypothetical protein
MNPLSKSTLSAIFRRKGGSGVRTHLFDDLSRSDQLRFVRTFNLDATEQPVLVSTGITDSVLLLTTENLLWGDSKKIQRIPLVNISWQHPIRSGAKRSWSQIKVETFEGPEFVLSAEAGKPFFGLWNVLLYISRRNLKVRSTA